MSRSPEHAAFVVAPGSPRSGRSRVAGNAAARRDAPARVAVVGKDVRVVLAPEQAAQLAARIESERPRWTWWSAQWDAAPLIAAGLAPARAWDVRQAHRLIFGGGQGEPGQAWAAAHGLDLAQVPAPPTGDLFEVMDSAPESGLVRPDGHLRPDAVAGTWCNDDELLLSWADAALTCARAQRAQAARCWPRLVVTVHAESAAAVLCAELTRDGLPVDRARLLQIVSPMSGPRDARDAQVLAHVPGREHIDLRNPLAVRDLLASVGIEVASTRKHVLEAYRNAHPVVSALLAWRAQERIATTYGPAWIQEHIGPDDRLRGQWNPADGAAGRMSADSGLHNLPVTLRPGVAAEPGHRFVRADLGQIEPRVLAVVSGDEAFAAASRAEDLYAPVAARLGVERSVAKIAVLAAMYGQRSGAAGEALRGLERSYPVAMRYLDRAYAAGCAGEPVRTYGGRLIRTGAALPTAPQPDDPALTAARGRFARNAVIQGAAAELFKAWAVTVRAALHPRARIVLCLHDELLVHVPQELAESTAQALDTCLQDASRRWSGGAPVRFVADISVVQRWSEAK
ncbi:DNA polymerase [Gephyromycinifex aptenodytis]|uniref:DNA polymerase n=1 Tax=Gephyromycinifex aptenodytis TaxID=2716227 RepID=UPI001D00E34A|nr:DNA polymerase [Gephyromycinifex aptenodytis]